MLCGTGLGSAVAPLAAYKLTAAFGWRGAYLALGLTALCVVPMLLWIFRDSSDVAGVRKSDRTRLVTLGQLLRSRHFYALAYAGLMLTVTLATMLIHIVPLLTSMGIGRGTAAAIAGSIGLSSIAGRIVMGFLLDRSKGPALGACTFALPMVAAGLLLIGGNVVWIAALAAILLGFASGGETDILAFMTTRYFGVRIYGRVFGLFAAAMAFGMGMGPWLTGLWIDGNGSYRTLLMALIPFTALAALLIGTLGPWRQVIALADSEATNGQTA
jgi:predicted MFS family arabinose efflux permease